MGKGGKGKPAKEQQEDSEEEVEEQEYDEEDFDDDEEYEDSSIDGDSLVLKKIEDQILEADEPLKLSWAAVHNLKIKQKELLQKMDQEMRKIQEKYDSLKNPIAEQIAKIVAGHPVQKKLYTEHELTKTISPNKHKPTAIPNFWLKVFEKGGFIDDPVDEEIMKSCYKVSSSSNKVEQGEKYEQTIKISFYFHENTYFNNKELKIQIKRVDEECERIHLDKLDLKGEKSEDSFMTKFFDPESDVIYVYQCAQDIERCYKNSVFFFFNQVQIDQNPELEDGEDDDDQDDQEDQEEDIKPVAKKRKKNEQPPVEKPECKQQ